MQKNLIYNVKDAVSSISTSTGDCSMSWNSDEETVFVRGCGTAPTMKSPYKEFLEPIGDNPNRNVTYRRIGLQQPSDLFVAGNGVSVVGADSRDIDELSQTLLRKELAAQKQFAVLMIENDANINAYNRRTNEEKTSRMGSCKIKPKKGATPKLKLSAKMQNEPQRTNDNVSSVRFEEPRRRSISLIESRYKNYQDFSECVPNNATRLSKSCIHKNNINVKPIDSEVGNNEQEVDFGKASCSQNSMYTSSLYNTKNIKTEAQQKNEKYAIGDTSTHMWSEPCCKAFLNNIENWKNLTYVEQMDFLNNICRSIGFSMNSQGVLDKLPSVPIMQNCKGNDNYNVNTSKTSIPVDVATQTMLTNAKLRRNRGYSSIPSCIEAKIEGVTDAWEEYDKDTDSLLSFETKVCTYWPGKQDVFTVVPPHKKPVESKHFMTSKRKLKIRFHIPRSHSVPNSSFNCIKIAQLPRASGNEKSDYYENSRIIDQKSNECTNWSLPPPTKRLVGRDTAGKYNNYSNNQIASESCKSRQYNDDFQSEEPRRIQVNEASDYHKYCRGNVKKYNKYADLAQPALSECITGAGTAGKIASESWKLAQHNNDFQFEQPRKALDNNVSDCHKYIRGNANKFNKRADLSQLLLPKRITGSGTADKIDSAPKNQIAFKSRKPCQYNDYFQPELHSRARKKELGDNHNHSRGNAKKYNKCADLSQPALSERITGAGIADKIDSAPYNRIVPELWKPQQCNDDYQSKQPRMVEKKELSDNHKYCKGNTKNYNKCGDLSEPALSKFITDAGTANKIDSTPNNQKAPELWKSRQYNDDFQSEQPRRAQHNAVSDNHKHSRKRAEMYNKYDDLPLIKRSSGAGIDGKSDCARSNQITSKSRKLPQYHNDFLSEQPRRAQGKEVSDNYKYNRDNANIIYNKRGDMAQLALSERLTSEGIAGKIDSAPNNQIESESRKPIRTNIDKDNYDESNIDDEVQRQLQRADLMLASLPLDLLPTNLLRCNEVYRHKETTHIRVSIEHAQNDAECKFGYDDERKSSDVDTSHTPQRLQERTDIFARSQQSVVYCTTTAATDYETKQFCPKYSNEAAKMEPFCQYHFEQNSIPEASHAATNVEITPEMENSRSCTRLYEDFMYESIQHSPRRSITTTIRNRSYIEENCSETKIPHKLDSNPSLMLTGTDVEKTVKKVVSNLTYRVDEAIKTTIPQAATRDEACSECGRHTFIFEMTSNKSSKISEFCDDNEEVSASTQHSPNINYIIPDSTYPSIGWQCDFLPPNFKAVTLSEFQTANFNGTGKRPAIIVNNAEDRRQLPDCSKYKLSPESNANEACVSPNREQRDSNAYDVQPTYTVEELCSGENHLQGEQKTSQFAEGQTSKYPQEEKAEHRPIELNRYCSMCQSRTDFRATQNYLSAIEPRSNMPNYYLYDQDDEDECRIEFERVPLKEEYTGYTWKNFEPKNKPRNHLCVPSTTTICSCHERVRAYDKTETLEEANQECYIPRGSANVYCPINGCGKILDETMLLSHYLKEHISGTDIQFNEIFFGELCSTELKLDQIKSDKNYAIRILALGGTQNSEESLPVVEGWCMHNNYLKNQYQGFIKHMPMLLMFSRVRTAGCPALKKTSDKYIYVFWIASAISHRNIPIQAKITVSDKAKTAVYKTSINVRNIAYPQDPHRFFETRSSYCSLDQVKMDSLSCFNKVPIYIGVKFRDMRRQKKRLAAKKD